MGEGLGVRVLCRSRIKNLRDVRMIHHRESLPLGLEPGNDLPAIHAQFDDLEGDATFDRLALLGHPDFAEAAFAELLEQFVAAEHLRRGCLRREIEFENGPISLQRRLLHESILVKMIGQQGFHPGPQHRLLAAGAVQKGAAFHRRVLFQRLEEYLLLRTAPGCG